MLLLPDSIPEMYLLDLSKICKFVSHKKPFFYLIAILFEVGLSVSSHLQKQNVADDLLQNEMKIEGDQKNDHKHKKNLPR